MAEDTLMELDGAKRVVELYHPEKEWKGLIVLWQSHHITVCWKNSVDKKVHCCYTSSEPFEDGFYIAQAFYTEPGEKFGYRVRELHREKTKLPTPTGITERITAGAEVR